MGTRVPCPHCKSPITLRADTCDACGGHFQPVHRHVGLLLLIIVLVTIISVMIMLVVNELWSL